MRELASLDYGALAREAIDNGGFTVALDGTRPTAGYVVALPNHERRYQLNTRTGYAHAIYAYVVDNGRVLRDPGAHLGAWVDNGQLYLDVVHVVTDRESAITLGQLNGQLAIYDLNTGEDIRLTRSEA